MVKEDAECSYREERKPCQPGPPRGLSCHNQLRRRGRGGSLHKCRFPDSPRIGISVVEGPGPNGFSWRDDNSEAAN